MSHWGYLPFLLAWALPIVAIEWLLGGRYLWRERWLWPWVVLGLGAYFSIADAIAIEAGIWRFDTRALTGIAIGPVPIEEVLFYLLTAAMVVQGFVVFWFGAHDSWRLLALPRRVRRRDGVVEGQQRRIEGRTRYQQGVIAVPLALAPAFGVAALYGVPTPLEPLAEAVMQLTPVAAANMLLSLLGAFARTAALLGAFAITLPIGGALGMLAPVGAWRQIARGGWSGWPRWLAVLALDALVTLPLVLAAPYPAQAAAAVLAGAVFPLALLLVRGWPWRRANADARASRVAMAAVKKGTNRRAFLRKSAATGVLVAGIVVLGSFDLWSNALGAALGRGEVLRRLFPFLPPGPRQPGFPVAGMEPEVTPIANFYLLSKNDVDPVIVPEDWALRIDGAVSQPRTLTYGELLALPRMDEYVTLRCVNNMVNGHLMSTALWSGVSLAALLREAGVDMSAAALMLHAPDAYDEIVPLDAALAGTTLLAYGMNGETLERRHGGPVRLLVPGYFGFKNVKWIEGITVVRRVAPSYWASRGWTATQLHSVARIDVAQPAPGGLLVAGIGFTGTHGVSAVQVRLDDGPWQNATLNAPALSMMSWVQWRVLLPAARGAHQITARVIDGAGQVQDASERDVFPGGATGLDSVRVPL